MRERERNSIGYLGYRTNLLHPRGTREMKWAERRKTNATPTTGTKRRKNKNKKKKQKKKKAAAPRADCHRSLQTKEKEPTEASRPLPTPCFSCYPMLLSFVLFFFAFFSVCVCFLARKREEEREKRKKRMTRNDPLRRPVSLRLS